MRSDPGEGRHDAGGALREALRLDPDRLVETGAEVLDRDRVRELDDLGVVEVRAKPVELGERVAFEVACKLAQLDLAQPGFGSRQMRTEVHAPLAADHGRGAKLS